MTRGEVRITACPQDAEKSSAHKTRNQQIRGVVCARVVGDTMIADIGAL